MVIALIESNIAWEDKEKNVNSLIEQLVNLKNENVDLVLLPEMSFTGFSMNTAKTREADGFIVNKIKETSGTLNTAIGFGWVKDCGEKCENHYTLVSGGDLLIDYVKIHPFSYGGEDNYFIGGNQLVYKQFKDFCVGIQICYDLRFPEMFQILSKKASLIIVPANWPQKRKEHWNTLLKARAIENQVYIAGVNCVGEMGGQIYSGDSAIISPLGEEINPLKIFKTNDGNIFIYEINNDVEKYRTAFPVKNDRNEKLYKELQENFI